MDHLLEENKQLKLEIANLKGTQSAHINDVWTRSSYTSVTAAPTNNSKVLVVKQKGQRKDVKQVKTDLQEKVNPEDLGIGVSMSRTTKDGGLILACGNEKQITDIQSEIQSKLGEKYEVEQPKIRDNRIKVVGLDESEYSVSEEDIVRRVIKQNDLDAQNKNFKLKILRKTNVINGRFNIIFEADSNTYSLLINRQKMNLGWSRCVVYSDYGIIRCYKCNK